MERDLAGIRLTISDFERLAALCRDDPKFPISYAAWRSLIDDGMRQLLSEGRAVEPVALDVDAYALWCRRVALQPGLDALRAYAIIQRRSTRTGAGDSGDAPHGTPRGRRRPPGSGSKSSTASSPGAGGDAQRPSATGPRPA